MRKSIGLDALKLTISKMLTLSITFVNAMLLSRFRTLEEYGTYSQMLLIVNLAITFFMLGLPSSINYFLAREDSEKRKQKFLSVYYSLSTFLSFIMGIVLVLSVPVFVQYFDNPLLENYLYFFAIFPWTQIIMSSVEHVLIIYNKTKYLMLYKITNSMILLSILLIAQTLKISFSTYLIFYIIVEVFFSFMVYLIVRNISNKLFISFDVTIIKSIFNFSIPIGLASIVSRLSIELDKLVIGRFYTTEELAIYANAARELPVTVIASALTAVLMPELVKLLRDDSVGNNKKAIKLWEHSIVLSYIFISLIAFGMCTFSVDVITLLYSTKYVSGSPVFQIYSLILLFRVTYFGIILNAKGKTKFIFYSSLLSLSLNVVLNYLFYQLFGYIGPALATLFSISIVQLSQLIVTSRVLEINIREIFPWTEVFLITIINIIFSGIFSYFKTIVNLEKYMSSSVESIILGFIWSIIYLSLMFKQIKIHWNQLKMM